jgi:hypothetical protein
MNKEATAINCSLSRKILPFQINDYNDQITEFCGKNASQGYRTMACEKQAHDYLRSNIDYFNDDCSQKAIMQSRWKSIVLNVTDFLSYAVEATRIVSDPHVKRRLMRRTRAATDLRGTLESSCFMHAAITCILNATIVLDLDCDYDEALMFVGLAGVKYVCAGADPDLMHLRSSWSEGAYFEYVYVDVEAEDVFAQLRARSVLWDAGRDVALVLTRNRFEFQSYASSMAFTTRLHSSGAQYVAMTGSPAWVVQNPWSHNDEGYDDSYSRLDLHLWPFVFPREKLLWMDGGLKEYRLLQVWPIASLPRSFPRHYSPFVCEAPHALPESVVRACASEDPSHWALFVNAAQRSRHSQSGQDGSLEYIFRHIGEGGRRFVEFGFNGDSYESDSGANTHSLYLRGWSGLLLDGGHSNASINLHAEWITPENIVSLFEKYSVPREVDYVSIDMDSCDLWVFRAILASGRYRPRVVSVEYNSNYALESTLANIGGSYAWRLDRIQGSSLLPLRMVGEEFGYSLVDVVPYLDAIFVRSDILNGSLVPPFETWRRYTRRVHHGGGGINESDVRSYVADYSVYVQSGLNLEAAMGDVVIEQIRDQKLDLL